MWLGLASVVVLLLWRHLVPRVGGRDVARNRSARSKNEKGADPTRVSTTSGLRERQDPSISSCTNTCMTSYSCLISPSQTGWFEYSW